MWITKIFSKKYFLIFIKFKINKKINHLKRLNEKQISQNKKLINKY